MDIVSVFFGSFLLCEELHIKEIISTFTNLKQNINNNNKERKNVIKISTNLSKNVIL